MCIKWFDNIVCFESHNHAQRCLWAQRIKPVSTYQINLIILITIKLSLRKKEFHRLSLVYYTVLDCSRWVFSSSKGLVHQTLHELSPLTEYHREFAFLISALNYMHTKTCDCISFFFFSGWFPIVMRLLFLSSFFFSSFFPV